MKCGSSNSATHDPAQLACLTSRVMGFLLPYSVQGALINTYRVCRRPPFASLPELDSLVEYSALSSVSANFFTTLISNISTFSRKPS